MVESGSEYARRMSETDLGRSVAVFGSAQSGLAVCVSCAIVGSLALPAHSQAPDAVRQDSVVVDGLDLPYSAPATFCPLLDCYYCSRLTAEARPARAPSGR